ncbi:MAG: helix-turn-helix transcriptional regulator [Chloroflexi bacterium]|nr:helix-turn-helix transcriptional regulator [Chloroflexota bacterium]
MSRCGWSCPRSCRRKSASFSRTSKSSGPSGGQTMVGYLEHDEPCFAISVAARIVGLHAQTLRYYEKAGLVQPSRSKGRNRLYSQADVERLRQIRRLTDDLGLNLAGVEIIIRMTDRIAEMDEEMEAMRRRLEAANLRLPNRRSRSPALVDGQPNENKNG